MTRRSDELTDSRNQRATSPSASDAQRDRLSQGDGEKTEEIRECVSPSVRQKPSGGERGFSLAERLALTIPEAAQAVGVSERHLRSILPEIPHLYLGKRVVIPVDALREWLLDRAKAEPGRVEKIAEEVLRAIGDQ